MTTSAPSSASAGSAGGDRAFAEQRLGAALGAVPHRQFVAGGKQAYRHGYAHLAQS